MFLLLDWKWEGIKVLVSSFVPSYLLDLNETFKWDKMFCGRVVAAVPAQLWKYQALG